MPYKVQEVEGGNARLSDQSENPPTAKTLFFYYFVIRFIENPPRDRYHYHPQYSLHLYRYVKVERV